MEIDFSSIESILGGVDKILTISTGGANTTLPPFIILTGIPKRNGLNVQEIYQNIITKKEQFGLPVGALPSSNADEQAPSPDEMMELIRIQAIVDAIQFSAKVVVEIPAGTTITGSGISPTGPVTIFGTTTMITKGYAQIF